MRRAAAVAVGLLLCGAVAPATASAQTDAGLGCAYTVAPDRAGPVGHSNRVRVVITDCMYEWDTLEVRLRNRASSTRTSAPAGFACDDGGSDILCARAGGSTAGAALVFRPQCPNSGRLRLTLAITDGAGARRVGGPKSLDCTRPPVKVLRPPARQSLGTALSRGVLARFSCRMRCKASVALLADTARGEKVGSAVVRRTRSGTYLTRVRLEPAYRRRWRRRAGVWLTVRVTLTARTGEQVMLGHVVRLRR